MELFGSDMWERDDYLIDDFQVKKRVIINFILHLLIKMKCLKQLHNIGQY